MAVPTVTAAGADNSGTTGAVTYALPGHQADDILLLVCETNLTTGLTTATSGWAHITNSPRAQGSNVTSVSVFWKRAASGSETNPVVDASSNHQVGFAFGVRGCVTSGDPWDFAPVGSGNASGSGMSATGGTTTVADCLVIIASGNQTDTASDNYTTLANSTLSDEAILNQAFTTDGNGGGVMVATGSKATAGATGTTTATITTAGGTANLVFALVGASGSATTADAECAEVSAGAQTPAASVGAASGVAAVTATAEQPTVSTAATTNAPAECAAVTATAEQPALSRTKLNDFESGSDTTAISTGNSASPDAWNTILGTAPTFATGAAVHGSLGMSAQAASGAQSAVKWTGLGSTSLSVVFYYKYTTRTILTQLVQFRTAVGASAGIVQNAAGNTIGATDSTGANLSPSAVSAAMTNGSTYRFEVQVFSDATTGNLAYQMYLGESGTALTTYTSGDNDNLRGGNITEFSIGKFSTSTDATAFLFDTVKAVDNTLTPLGSQGSASTNAPAECAEVVVVAQDPGASVTPVPAEAAVTATAQGPTPNVQPNAEAVTVTAAAEQPAASIQPTAAPALPSATAEQPTPSISVPADVASVTATAEQPTVSTAGVTNASAEVASVTATALDPSISIAATADVAAIGADASAPSALVAPTAGVAAVDAGAEQPAASVAPTADVAAVGATAEQPTVQTGGIANAPADVAAVSATAETPAASIGAPAESADAAAVAQQPTASVAAAAGAADIAVAAEQPTSSIAVSADVASVTATAEQPTVSTSAATNANAECADVTATAGQSAGSVAPTPGSAEVGAASDSASVSAAVAALFAAVASVVDDPTVAVGVNPTAAEANVGTTAHDAGTQVDAAAAPALVAATAQDATAIGALPDQYPRTLGTYRETTGLGSHTEGSLGTFRETTPDRHRELVTIGAHKEPT